jgi:hypothetical protein
VAAARTALGEELYATTLAEGRVLSLDEALGCGLEDAGAGEETADD